MNSPIIFYAFIGYFLIASLPQIILSIYSKNKGLYIVFSFLLLLCALYEYVLLKMYSSKSHDEFFLFFKYLSLVQSVGLTLQVILVSFYTNIFYKRVFWFTFIISIVNIIFTLFIWFDLISFFFIDQHLFSKPHVFILENRFLVSCITIPLSLYMYILLAKYYANHRKYETLALLVILVTQTLLMIRLLYTTNGNINMILVVLISVASIISVSVFVSLRVVKEEVLYAFILQQKEMRLFKDDIVHFMVTDFKQPLDTLCKITDVDSKETIIVLVKATAFKMLNVITNMLDIYKYYQSGMRLNKSICNLKQIADSSLIRLNPLFVDKNIDVELTCSVDCNINIDGNLIKRVLINIIESLAQNINRNEKIILSIDELNDERLLIQISSKGVSYSKERMSQFFSELNNAYSKTYKNHSDMLSLSFCKIVIEAHKGEIGFKLENDFNSIFWFTLLSDSSNSTPTITVLKSMRDRSDIIVNLTNNEKRYMSRYYQRLIETESFEISKLKLITAELEKDIKINSKWLSEFKLSIKEMDDEKYLYLRSIINPK
jgi:hypothetical protein